MILAKYNISIIIVLYKPIGFNIEDIVRQTINSDNHKLVIVDNTPNQNLGINNSEQITYIPLFENKGIAEAQNIGINLSIEKGADYLIFFDQDSIIPENYIINILNSFLSIKNYYPNLATIGPRIIDKNNKVETKSRLRKKSKCKSFLICNQIISSGSIIPTEIIKKVGSLRSDLFIDYVDLEWCWRAKSFGYVCGQTTFIYMDHKIGTQESIMGKFNIDVSAIPRYYYMYRNYIRLMLLDYVPLKWKISHGARLFFKFFYFPVILNNGNEIFKNMVKGIRDGLTNTK